MTAKAFVDNDETRAIIKLNKQKLVDSGFALPDLSKKYKMTVYWLQSGFAKHASLVFTSNGEHCVTAEIAWYTPGGVYHVIPHSSWFKLSEHPERTEKMLKCGTVHKSTNDLIEAGIKAAKNFGAYEKYTNNCQSYCNCVLEMIGLDARWTDTGLVLAGSTVLAPVVYAAMKARQAFD